MEQTAAVRAVVRDGLAIVAAGLVVGVEDDLFVESGTPVLDHLHYCLAV